jgi:solute carrier family 25 protein 34/35
MQLQGELQSKGSQPRVYKGPISGVNVIIRNEGLRGVYRGIAAASCYQLIINGCRLGFYGPIRESMTRVIYTDPLRQSFGVNVFAGAASGILGAVAGSPFFLVKTRLQSFSTANQIGTQHPYKSATDGFRQIYSNEGLRGLYRGVGSAVVRTGFGSSVQLPTYFFAKRKLMQHLKMKEGPPLHLASSAASGFVVCCVMHPPGKGPYSWIKETISSLSLIDTFMSRLYNQDGKLYKGMFDCFTKTVKTEGIFAIYKGFLPHLCRILPHTILTLSFAEQTTKLVRQVELKLL